MHRLPLQSSPKCWTLGVVTTIVGEKLGVLACHPAPDAAVTRPVDCTMSDGWGARKVTRIVKDETDAIFRSVKFSIRVQLLKVSAPLTKISQDVGISEGGCQP